MDEKLKVGILGATGMVGQRFITLLDNHPWFEVVTVAASPRSAGKTYEEAVGGRWKMDTPMPEAVKKLIVLNVNEVEKVASTVDFVFSAVDMTKDEIRAIEEEYAKTETPVVSNNSAHRWTPDVPKVVPEINPQHFDVIRKIALIVCGVLVHNGFQRSDHIHIFKFLHGLYLQFLCLFPWLCLLALLFFCGIQLCPDGRLFRFCGAGLLGFRCVFLGLDCGGKVRQRNLFPGFCFCFQFAQRGRIVQHTVNHVFVLFGGKLCGAQRIFP